MTSTTSTAKAKTYNLMGAISSVALHQDKKDRPFASFTLTRPTGKTQRCVVFAEHIAKVQAAAESAQGGNVILWGMFDRRQYQKADGKTGSSVTFKALWAGLPKSKAAAAENQNDDTAQAAA